VRRSRLLHTESFRLATAFALLFIGFAMALVIVAYWIFDHMQTAVLTDALDADIATINSGFAQEGLGEAEELVNQLLAPTGAVGRRHSALYIGLQDHSGRALAGNLPALPVVPGLMERRLSELQPGGSARKSDGSAGTPLLAKGITLPDGSYLVVARSMAPIMIARYRLVRAFSWTAAIAVLLAVGAGVAFGLRFMRRIDAMATTCHAIVAGRFSDRIALRGKDDELDRLATSINLMLDRIEALLDNLRQVSSDIAHDLRTPLTRLRQRLERTQHESQTAEHYSAAVTQALADSDELLSVFTALLRISQIEAGTRVASFASVSLSDLGARVFDMYCVVAQDMRHTLAREIQPDVFLQGDQELLLQLIVNLIENALQHTPAGTRIELVIGESQGRAFLEVRDSGPGVPPMERDKVLRRFYRLADSRAGAGNGLGLALVSAIASLHGAALTLSDNTPGLIVSLVFRAAQLRKPDTAAA
jgi:signal transduction histidine kinase